MEVKKIGTHFRLTLLLLVLIAIAAGFICVHYYSFVFARDVQGSIMDIERVNQTGNILGSNASAAAMFSFAVAIRDQTGEIVTASSEDRQWAVAHKGMCAEAKFLRYPPWELSRAGTFFGARLLRLYDCPPGTP